MIDLRSYRLHYNQDLVVNLTHERNSLQEVLQEQHRQVEKLSEIVCVVEKFAIHLIILCLMYHFVCLFVHFVH